MNQITTPLLCHHFRFLYPLGRCLLPVAFVTLSVVEGFSQPTLVWAKSMGGASDDRGYSIAIDGSGNVYTTGYFWGTADFDPGAGTYNLTPAGGSQDIFVSKLNGPGNFGWAG